MGGCFRSELELRLEDSRKECRCQTCAKCHRSAACARAVAVGTVASRRGEETQRGASRRLSGVDGEKLRGARVVTKVFAG